MDCDDDLVEIVKKGHTKEKVLTKDDIEEMLFPKGAMLRKKFGVGENITRVSVGPSKSEQVVDEQKHEYPMVQVEEEFKVADLEQEVPDNANEKSSRNVFLRKVEGYIGLIDRYVEEAQTSPSFYLSSREESSPSEIETNKFKKMRDHMYRIKWEIKKTSDEDFDDFCGQKDGEVEKLFTGFIRILRHNYLTEEDGKPVIALDAFTTRLRLMLCDMLPMTMPPSVNRSPFPVYLSHAEAHDLDVAFKAYLAPFLSEIPGEFKVISHGLRMPCVVEAKKEVPETKGEELTPKLLTELTVNWMEMAGCKPEEMPLTWQKLIDALNNLPQG